jgi:hypothetical protein
LIYSDENSLFTKKINFMKKRNFFLSAIAVTIALVSGWNIILSQHNSDVALPDMVLANVEALAYELSEVTITCGQSEGQCWSGYCAYRMEPGWILPMYCRLCDQFVGSQSYVCYNYDPC